MEERRLGGERRNGDRRQKSHLGARLWLVMTAVALSLAIFFSASYLNAQRQEDLLVIACGNAVGHRDLTIAVRESARISEDIARELGLPVEPVMIRVPRVPDECAGR